MKTFKNYKIKSLIKIYFNQYEWLIKYIFYGKKKKKKKNIEGWAT